MQDWHIYPKAKAPKCRKFKNYLTATHTGDEKSIRMIKEVNKIKRIRGVTTLEAIDIYKKGLLESSNN